MSQGPQVAPRPQLLTYPDSLGGNLAALADLLDGPLDGLFHGVHVLPPFPSSGDRGFAPLTYDEIDPAFGTWDDIRRLSGRHDVLLDLMINHISRQSPQFQDFLRLGRRSPAADLFLTLDKVWPDGRPLPDDVARIVLRKPDGPFSTVTVGEGREQERIWTTFGASGWSEQIDLDVNAPSTRALITGWLRSFAERGVRIVRLDAVGYVVKKPGTSCFMVEPEIYEFLAWVTGVAASNGMAVLPEVHDVHATHERLAAHGFWTYDFVLPGLLLHAFETGRSSRLAHHLAASPERQFTILDCHDGIPVRPDLDGVLAPHEMAALAAGVRRRGGNVNPLLTASPAGDGIDAHQLNVTYFSALDCDDGRYLAARAVQLFARGVPQLYYVGLLAGVNDAAAVQRTGEGRAINRHNFSAAEIDAALRRPVVQQVLALTRLRNTHPAFAGSLSVASRDDRSLGMWWTAGERQLRLDVDLEAGRASITEDGVTRQIASWTATGSSD